MHISLIICIEKASFKTRKRSLKFIDINIELNKTLVGKYFIQITFHLAFALCLIKFQFGLFFLLIYFFIEMILNFIIENFWKEIGWYDSKDHEIKSRKPSNIRENLLKSINFYLVNMHLHILLFHNFVKLVFLWNLKFV